ncbi:hypothetical protein QWY75_13240 [Pontixanthobacter aestiaquae]|uniref:DUF4189 domain-containing protein n=1 Tax=Pontixanthobacter aestiaquae TaxID=1509367 RepID=A0A844Z2Y5_9SPHN|nr:hypothetical protein [Pontixanthobacter aestiaquae]MDN3647171.1 hypothetical protein [Pontixanthobacter aestiaquae]MXO81854.1 hypothetical protein [Pontixanthobacter aestiaquae]
MKTLLIALGTVGALTFPAQAHAGAAAVCIEREKNSGGNGYDSEYFVRWGKSPNVDGATALRAAKRDHKKSYPNSIPYCYDSGSSKYPGGGHMVLIKSGRIKDGAGDHYNRWTLGVGTTRQEAISDAVFQMQQRDGVWSHGTHGYTIEEEHEI